MEFVQHLFAVGGLFSFSRFGISKLGQASFSHAANRLAPKFLQIENLSSRGKIILWRDKIPPDEKKSTALGDVPDSGNLCRNHAPNFLWRKVTDPLWRGCMPSGRSSTKTRFLQVNVDLLYL